MTPRLALVLLKVFAGAEVNPEVAPNLLVRVGRKNATRAGGVIQHLRIFHG